MFAAPGSSKDISDAVSEKFRLDKDRPKKSAKSKKKLDEYRKKAGRVIPEVPEVPDEPPAEAAAG